MEIELRPAYVWDCDNCGREVFERAIVPEMDVEERQQMKDDMGVQPWEEGYILLMPQEVTCPYCKKTFDVIPPLTDEEIDDADPL